MPRPLHQSKGEQIMNIEQERTEFEAWYRLHHGSRDVYGRDVSGEYVDKQVQGAFNVWQARAALSAAMQAEEEQRRSYYEDRARSGQSALEARP